MAQRIEIKVPEELLAMPTSAKKMEERKQAAKQAGVQIRQSHNVGYGRMMQSGIQEPGKVIAQHTIVSQLIRALQQLKSMSGRIY